MSHEFYQVMVGSPAMSIHGWKQLAQWSIQYSCLSEKQKARANQIFNKEWEDFCTWVVKTFKEEADKLEITPEGKLKQLEA
jgi:adenosine deaminase CECR1